MTATAAIIHCLNNISPELTDGEYQSLAVLDRNGHRHWVAFRFAGAVLLQSDSEWSPFHASLEPYREAP